MSPAWGIEYYETEAGTVPVLVWIEAMQAEEQAAALHIIDLLAELGLEAQAPLVKHLEGKLYELRWKAEHKQHRIAYVAARDRKFVLLHGFIKKSQATPKQELDTARKRLRDYERRLNT